MANRRKIIIMTKLALYDKTMGRADRRADRFYRRDFIYRQNMWSRFYASIMVIIGLLCYWVFLFFTTDMDLFNLDIEGMVSQAVFVLGVVLLAVTVVGTMKATADYQSAQARLARYHKLLNHLDKINAEEEGNGKRPLSETEAGRLKFSEREVSASEARTRSEERIQKNGTDIADTRSNNKVL